MQTVIYSYMYKQYKQFWEIKYTNNTVPLANTNVYSNVGLMFDYRLRRWHNFKILIVHSMIGLKSV